MVPIKVLLEPIISECKPTLPAKATSQAAGFDICSNERVNLAPGEFRGVKTGWRIYIPEGFEAQVRPRSGLALKHGVTVLNSPGTIDSDYRGEIGIILINLGKESFQVEPGMRIAQLIFSRVENVDFTIVSALPSSQRGGGGFGSTGVGPINT